MVLKKSKTGLEVVFLDLSLASGESFFLVSTGSSICLDFSVNIPIFKRVKKSALAKKNID